MKPISAHIYNVNTKVVRTFFVVLILTAIFCFIGIFLVIFNIKFITGLTKWNYLIVFIYSVFGIIISHKSLKNRKYFISLNKNEINYHMPKSENPIKINILEIQDILIHDNKIEILSKNNSTEILNLNYFYLPLKDEIKLYFSELKSKI